MRLSPQTAERKGMTKNSIVKMNIFYNFTFIIIIFFFWLCHAEYINQGSNPGPLHGVLIPGLPGKFQGEYYFNATF